MIHPEVLSHFRNWLLMAKEILSPEPEPMAPPGPEEMMGAGGPQGPEAMMPPGNPAMAPGMQAPAPGMEGPVSMPLPQGMQ